MQLEEEYPPGSVEASPAWQWVNDQVVAGICHDLNDRLSSLLGLLQLAELQAEIEPGVGGQLRSELGRVEELVRLLRLLPGGEAERPEPVRVSELIPLATGMLRRYRGLENIRVTLDAVADPVVRARPSTLVRVLLLLFAVAARSARAGGSDLVEVRLVAAEGAARIEIAPGGVMPNSTETFASVAERRRGLSRSDTALVESGVNQQLNALNAVRTEVEAAGGTLHADDTLLRLSFPALGG